MSGLTVGSMEQLNDWNEDPTVCHYNEESVRSVGGYCWRVSKPFIKVGPSDKKREQFGIRRTDDHKNKFK